MAYSSQKSSRRVSKKTTECDFEVDRASEYQPRVTLIFKGLFKIEIADSP
jgi:hypothetical protein